MGWIFGSPRSRGGWLFSRHDGWVEADVMLVAVQLTIAGAGLPLQMRVEGGGQRVVHWKGLFGDTKV